MSICKICGERKFLGHRCDPSKIALRNAILNSMGNESGPTYTGSFGSRFPTAVKQFYLSITDVILQKLVFRELLINSLKNNLQY